MRIGSFRVSTPLGATERIGALDGVRVIDLTAARAALLETRMAPAVARRVAHAQLPPRMPDVLEGGHAALEWLAEALAYAEGGRETTADGVRIAYALEEIELLAPVPRPPGIACFTTWRTHIADSLDHGFPVHFPERGSDIRPYYKGNPDSVIATGHPLALPGYAEAIDVECELAAVVLGTVKDLDADEAERAIAGYCVFNDVSVRGVQLREMRSGLGPTKGKDHDGGNVLGPWIVTPDEVGDPRNLEMSLTVNGERWSSHGTDAMEWTMAELLRYLSLGQTVRAGHVLTSGCYPGGAALDLGRELRPGDEVEVAISGLGTLANRIGAPAPIPA